MIQMTDSRSKVRIRNAAVADLDAILAVEQSWPAASRAGADKFIARLERFPQGFFVAELQVGGAPRIVATITSMPLVYDPANVKPFSGWSAVTNDGYLFEGRRVADCNAAYIVSGVIDEAYRSLDLFDAGVLAVVEAARSLGMRYVVAGAVIPGYRDYCLKHGETHPYAYCTMRGKKRLVDPLLAMYERIGFGVRDERHVIAGYYPDDASRNYAALVVREL